MSPTPFKFREAVSKIQFKYLAVCTFTVKVMACGTPLDLRENVFVKKTCITIMEGYAKFVQVVHIITRGDLIAQIIDTPVLS